MLVCGQGRLGSCSPPAYHTPPQKKASDGGYSREEYWGRSLAPAGGTGQEEGTGHQEGGTGPGGEKGQQEGPDQQKGRMSRKEG